jgi:ribonuclease BN (tRNA processing enzyme)
MRPTSETFGPDPRGASPAFAVPTIALAIALTIALTITLMISCARPSSPAPEKRTVLITLGTRGGPLPTRDRTQSSNLLIVDGALYLIDAGDNVTRRIVESGHDFRKIDQVFLTHLHGDHTAGLAHLVGSAWEYQRRKPLDVYGSGVEKLVAGVIESLKPNAEIRSTTGKTTPLTDVVRGREIEPGLVYQDANVKVLAVENTHFHFERDSLPYGKYRSYSYRFETPDRAIVLTGDTGVSDAVTELAKGADLLVTEVGDAEAVIELSRRSGAWQKKTAAEQEGMVRHLNRAHISPEEIGKMATRAGVKSVVLTHLVPTVDPDDDYQRYVETVKKFYAGPVFIAKDLMRF